MNNPRTYLDYNASAPLCDAARSAMIAAMDIYGNPSAIHNEGRAARMIVERARGQIADFIGCDGADLVFAGSASEASAMCFSAGATVMGSAGEHDALHAHINIQPNIKLDQNGRYIGIMTDKGADYLALQSANSETGVLQDTSSLIQQFKATQQPEDHPQCVIDGSQAFGKTDLQIGDTGGDLVIASPHKFGGPKGVGVLYVKTGIELRPIIRGGGQEQGRRAGTENLIGIAGAGAAAMAAQSDLKSGIWQQVAQLRDWLEQELQANAPDMVIIGRNTPRLPNTSCFALPGWSGELQVMQMDLAGFAISAGSACSSGKIRQSRVLKAMGKDDVTAQSAVRISIGQTHTKKQLESFVMAWTKAYRKFKAKAA